jgi:hypothetical protein
MVHRCSLTVVREGEGDTGESPRGLPELGERRSGWAMTVRRRQRCNSIGRLLEVSKE